MSQKTLAPAQQARAARKRNTLTVTALAAALLSMATIATAGNIIRVPVPAISAPGNITPPGDTKPPEEPTPPVVPEPEEPDALIERWGQGGTAATPEDLGYTKLNFGMTKQFVYLNTSTEPVVIRDSTLTGGATFDAGVGNSNTNCFGTLAPNAECRVTLRFDTSTPSDMKVYAHHLSYGSKKTISSYVSIGVAAHSGFYSVPGNSNLNGEAVDIGTFYKDSPTSMSLPVVLTFTNTAPFRIMPQNLQFSGNIAFQVKNFNPICGQGQMAQMQTCTISFSLEYATRDTVAKDFTGAFTMTNGVAPWMGTFTQPLKAKYVPTPAP